MFREVCLMSSDMCWQNIRLCARQEASEVSEVNQVVSAVRHGGVSRVHRPVELDCADTV